MTIPEFAGHCSSEILPLRTAAQLDPRYLFYWLRKEATVAEINRTCTGARMPRANMKDVFALPIPLPPLAEQKRIVAILDEAFEGIDTAMANTERNLVNARALFESYFATVFARHCGEWPEVSLADVCENLDRRRVPITKRDRKPGEVPYYGASGVVDHVEGHLFDEDLLLVSEDGANLLARTYPIAFSICGRAWVNNHAHVLRFKDMASQKFVEHYLNSISLKPYVSGMAQPKLNQKALNSIPIPFPATVGERAAIVERIESVFEKTQSLLGHYEQKRSELEALKQSILSEAFKSGVTAEPELARSQATEVAAQ